MKQPAPWRPSETLVLDGLKMSKNGGFMIYMFFSNDGFYRVWREDHLGFVANFGLYMVIS